MAIYNIINGASLIAINSAIVNHTVTVVEADGMIID
jgi:hypothetical protein